MQNYAGEQVHSFRLEEYISDQLNEYCDNANMKKTDVIRIAITEFLSRENNIVLQNRKSKELWDMIHVSSNTT
jgi:hypothetical protein